MSAAPRIVIERTQGADPAVPLPAYETSGAAGADLRANFAPPGRAEGVTLAPMERGLIPTGLRLQIPTGFEVQIRARSGLALRQGLALVNAPGTIDSDYRGEVGVIVINLGSEPVTIAHGERVAQMVVAPAPQAVFDTGVTDSTDRGAGGFGSTGRS